MEPITRSTDGFCHGARGAVTTLSMPTAPAVRRTSQPQIASRFRMTRTPATRHECWAHPRADWPPASGGSGPGCPRRRLVGLRVAAVTAAANRGQTRDGVSARRCLASRSRAPVASLATAWRAGPTAGGQYGQAAGALARAVDICNDASTFRISGGQGANTPKMCAVCDRRGTLRPRPPAVADKRLQPRQVGA